MQSATFEVDEVTAKVEFPQEQINSLKAGYALYHSPVGQALQLASLHRDPTVFMPQRMGSRLVLGKSHGSLIQVLQCTEVFQYKVLASSDNNGHCPVYPKVEIWPEPTSDSLTGYLDPTTMVVGVEGHV